ncbi:spermatogenesis-associated protein 33 isoform X2 [Nannospalax galili]|uniref:spermatogenesis-associated protein 33 isoform X2 n=1 Tax=Nannospalax galili TaxID=1026970 RepID=UPI00111BF8A3|nr:spermatogenesis-associated protein 33 isoform X2 [Nannospalax galili]
MPWGLGVGLGQHLAVAVVMSAYHSSLCEAPVRGAAGSPMGLSKSKPRKRKGEEHNKSPAHSVSKPKEKVMEKEAKPPDRDVPSQPADSLLMGAETAKYSQPSASSEGRRPQEACHIKASGMGQSSKTLMIQERNLIQNKSQARRKLSFRRSSSREPQMRC